MGQYWLPINLDKGEFISPHRLGAGLKLCEQLGSHVGTALIVLCAAMPESRGGGDLDLRTGKKAYDKIAKQVIGRWAGDAIALVGDYAEAKDLKPEDEADKLWGKCNPKTHTEYNDNPKGAMYQMPDDNPEHPGKYAHSVEDSPAEFLDITDLVCKVIEHELDGKFKGDGWREFVPRGETKDEARA